MFQMPGVSPDIPLPRISDSLYRVKQFVRIPVVTNPLDGSWDNREFIHLALNSITHLCPKPVKASSQVCQRFIASSRIPLGGASNPLKL